MKKTHYYLVDTSVVLPGAAVSALQFKIIEEEPFFVHNLKVSEVEHILYLVLQGRVFSHQLFLFVTEDKFLYQNI